MREIKKLIIIIILIVAWLLIYSPHFSNKFPLHIDEYQHISSAIKLSQNQFSPSFSNIEIGFHIFLAIIAQCANLIHIYQYLPAIWIVITCLTLCYILNQKTKELPESFFITIFTLIFFISIKSNVNLLGFWFFVPLTFAVPFIFLYLHFFTQGIKQEKTSYLLYALAIMLLLLPIHAIAVLFAIPLLIIYTYLEKERAKNQIKILVLFILIPLAGLLFFKIITQLPLDQIFSQLFKALLFKKGWGVLEINNSPFELYSPVGYLLAIVGIVPLLSNKKYKELFLLDILWPIMLLISIIIFKLTGISPFSPYQRNFFYLVLALPFLSAFGLYQILAYIKNKTNQKNYKIIKIGIITAVILLTFVSYYSTPQQVRLYKTIDQSEYETLIFLKNYPPATIIAPLQIAHAVFPVSGHQALATYYFDGNREVVEKFYQTTDCKLKNRIIKDTNTSFVYTKNPQNCSWKEIYNKDGNYIYLTANR